MFLLTTLDVAQLVAPEPAHVSFVARTLRSLGVAVEPPSVEKMLTQLLDKCCKSVEARVLGFLKAAVVPVSLTVDTTGALNGADVVNYMAAAASSGQVPLLLDAVERPSGADADASADWAARDLARVVKKLASPVAGCVLPCSRPHSRQTRERLEKQFPGMYFHGCMRNALLTLARQIFVPSAAVSESDRKHSVALPFSQDLQQCALQCQDLVFLLPRREEVSYLGKSDSTDNRLMHVTVRRRLTVEDGFVAILQAEPFLDADKVLDQLLCASPEETPSDGLTRTHHSDDIAHLQTQLTKVVRSSQFTDKLRKYLGIIRPIHALLLSLSGDAKSSPMLLSEVYASFSQLVQELAANPLLQPEEKTSLHILVRQQQERVLGTAHFLSYLLDPVLLGENLTVDTKAEAEQKLMASFHADGSPLSDTDKEALYEQYMDFKKFAFNQKANKADTLAFRTLKERKKSPLEFWFVDGAKWPSLQAIACRIFVMPVCTFSAKCVISAAGIDPIMVSKMVDARTSANLTYVRVNSRQLHVAESSGTVLTPATHNPQLESSSNDITASMVV
ncbi:unnamed protein product [Phytophthora fragariaefolia]|uniref:Unnamed protein product n=1 Tax=Phytophthora fragariaefolia TaxID=1490495 RepID=A0A9W6X0K8_9STRA|nr:unnamed protein product [Phytophthora fragariaefolia]